MCTLRPLSFSHPLLQSCSPSTPSHMHSPSQTSSGQSYDAKCENKETSINRSITDLIYLSGIHLLGSTAFGSFLLESIQATRVT